MNKINISNIKIIELIEPTIAQLNLALNEDSDFLAIYSNGVIHKSGLNIPELYKVYAKGVYDTGIRMFNFGVHSGLNFDKPNNSLLLTNTGIYSSFRIGYYASFISGFSFISVKGLKAIGESFDEKSTSLQEELFRIYKILETNGMVPELGWFPDLDKSFQWFDSSSAKIPLPIEIFHPKYTYDNKTNDIDMQFILQRIELNYSNKKKLYEIN